MIPAASLKSDVFSPLFLLATLAAALAGGCAVKYEYKPIPVKDISAYHNNTSVLGAQVGAEAYWQTAALRRLFGFNLKEAGLIPVQVAVDNPGSRPLTILRGARVLDEGGDWWELLPEHVVYNRVNDYTSGGLDGERLFRRSFLYGLAGGVVGAAVGVVAGVNVAEAAGKGAAVGGALGAASEIAATDENRGSPEEVALDFSSRDLGGGRVVAAGAVESGFLYFPSEMKRPVRLRLYFAPGDAAASSARTGAASGKATIVELPL
ncbi:MAG: hypothetical protein LBS31_02830 [Candidatus Adiutrix sp.]|jgi:hypothetical protein|nr:hypothetical protein [Candidatus Adiutrix sp.]